jgi:hypothetical protein
MRFFGFEFLSMIAAIALAAVCWGAYGPVLHRGQMGMEQSRLRPFVCVGLAYFAIAVVVPAVILYLYGEEGSWINHDASGLGRYTGVLWSLGGGAAGAIGALGVIMAFYFRGPPSVVMPLVFGFAPVVNAFLTIYMAGTWKEFTPMRMSVFFAGLILVAVGAVTVLATAPRPRGHAPPSDAVEHAESATDQ